MTEETTYKITAQDFEKIKYQLKQDALDTIYSEYATRVLDIGAAAQVLGVSVDTLRNYVYSGRIKTEPRLPNQVLKFRLSELLKSNIKKYQR